MIAKELSHVLTYIVSFVKSLLFSHVCTHMMSVLQSHVLMYIVFLLSHVLLKWCNFFSQNKPLVLYIIIMSNISSIAPNPVRDYVGSVLRLTLYVDDMDGIALPNIVD